MSRLQAKAEELQQKLAELRYSEESSRKATRSEGDDLEESATRALMRHGRRGRGEIG
jgi:hypothetical protein